MRIQNPQTNRYVIGITIFHWNCTTEIQEVFLGSIFEGVCVHGECEVRVGLVNSLQFFYGQVPELIPVAPSCRPVSEGRDVQTPLAEKLPLGQAMSYFCINTGVRGRMTPPRSSRVLVLGQYSSHYNWAACLAAPISKTLRHVASHTCR